MAASSYAAVLLNLTLNGDPVKACCRRVERLPGQPPTIIHSGWPPDVLEDRPRPTERGGLAQQAGRTRRSAWLLALAVVAPAEDVRRANAPFDHRLAGIRVLLVDDDSDNLRLMSKLLTVSGRWVRTAAGADAAFAALSVEAPDLLLTDIHMPDGDGFDLLARVRARPPRRGGLVPAVALTGDDDNVKSLKADFAAHLVKPVTPSHLIETVRRLARRRRVD